MTTIKRQRFVAGVTAWMLTSVLWLTMLDSMGPELFFVLSLIGVLVVVELTAPVNVTPQWRRRLLVVIALGLVVFVAIVTRRIVSILKDQGTISENLIHLGGL
jgi:hypothetical protein